jgi:hypothetical protein
MPVAFAFVRSREKTVFDRECAAFQHGFHRRVPRRFHPDVRHVVFRQKKGENGRNDQKYQEAEFHGRKEDKSSTAAVPG